MKTALVSSHIRQLGVFAGSSYLSASQSVDKSALLDAVANRCLDDKVGNPDCQDGQHKQDCQAENCLPLHCGLKCSHVHSSVPPAASYLPPLRGRPGENSKPSGASDGKDGRGVSTKKPSYSNLDKSQRRIVKSGCNVRFYGAVGRVIRVRLGQACVDWAGGLKGDYIRCAALEVVV